MSSGKRRTFLRSRYGAKWTAIRTARYQKALAVAGRWVRLTTVCNPPLHNFVSKVICVIWSKQFTDIEIELHSIMKPHATQPADLVPRLAMSMNYVLALDVLDDNEATLYTLATMS